MSNDSIHITAENFGSVLKEILNEHGKEVQKTMEDVAKKVGKKGAKKIKTSSPKKTGDYAKGWRTSIEKTDFGIEVVVHNKTDYQLTHLLEHGHANRNGGRTKPITHIAPVNDDAQEEFFNTVIRELGG